MLDNITKKNIDDCRDVLVGKVPDPKSQIEQITLALIYKFMDDMDKEAVEKFKGKAKFFTGEYAKYGWRKLFDPSLNGTDMLALYSEALEKLNTNPNIPELFRNIFKNAYLPYRDPSTLKLFLKYINEFEYSHSEKLGDAFEYLLSVMGSQGDAGQFRTPRHIIDFVTACVNPQKNETVLDPACGTAGFLLSAYKHILNYELRVMNDELPNTHNSSLITNNKKKFVNGLTPDERRKLGQNIVGYDISPDMVRLSLANMYLHGFSTPNIHEYDTLSSEDRWQETFDVILANPPFMTPKGGIRPHKKFGVQANKAEVLFTDYIAEHLNSNGRAGIVVPNGIVATSQTAYKELRKHLVNDSLIAVISLPAGCFNPYSGVKTSVLILDKRLAKKSKHILFLKIENDGFDLGAQRREHNKNDLPLALKTLEAFKDCLLNLTGFENLLGLANGLATIVEKQTILGNKDIVLSAERYFKTEVSQTEFDLVKLSEVCDVVRGITFGKNDQVESENEGTIKVATTKACQEFGIIEKDLYNIPKRFVKDEKKYLQNGDVLISTANSLNLLGRTTFVTQLKYKTSFGAFMTLVRPKNEMVLPLYLLHCLKTEQAKKYYELNANTTTNISNLTFESLNAFEIPLPPIEIQQQIVAEIEGCQKIIDGAKQVVNNYKPTITINPLWETIGLEEVSSFKNGLNYTKDNKGISIKIIGVGDFKNYLSPKINTLEQVIIGDKIPNEILLKENDLVFVRSNGNKELVGRCMIIPKLNEDISFTGFSIRLRFNDTRCVPLFYCHLFRTDFFRKILSGKEGANISNISQERLKEIQIPLPSIQEQKEIVKTIEEEIQLVSANKRLIEIFEQKIKIKISEVWRVKEQELSHA